MADPDRSGEGAVARYIAGWLAGTGAEIEVAEVEPGRPNVLARLRGTGGGPTLCLNAHTDTVGFEGWPDEALVPRIEGDIMYGLGAADDKSGVAASMLVLRAIAESGVKLRGDLLIACVADEEGVSIGSEHLAAHYREHGGIDACVVIEPQLTEEIVVEAMTAVLGGPPKITGMNGWTDAALMQATGIPTLLMGSAGGNYHTAGEWTSISGLVSLCHILERAVTRYLA